MRSRMFSACAVALVGLTVGGCTDGGDLADLGPRQASATVTIGSADGASSRIAALIYAGALRGIGTQVDTRLGLGDSGAAIAAVERGEVTVTPALTGQLWQRYRPGAPLPAPSGPQEAKAQWDAQFVALSAVLPDGLGLGDPTPAVDQPMLFVRSGGPSASLRGCEGLTGPVAVPAGSPVDLAGRYGCSLGPVLTVADEAAAARAVADGAAGVAQLGTLSPATLGLSQVPDPDGRVVTSAVVALLRRDGLTVAQTKRLSAVAGELETSDLAAMVVQVSAGEKTAEAVAGEWAAEHPLS